MLIATTLLALSAFGETPTAAPYRYVPATSSGPKPTLPDGGYVPFDWAVGEVPAAGGSMQGVTLTWNVPNATTLDNPGRATLRITSATDVRENVEVTVKTAVSGKLVGTFDLRFAMYLQPFELPVPAADVPAVLSEGVTLTMTRGTKPFWFFGAETGPKSAPTAYQPHLLVYQEHHADEATTAGSPDRWQDRLLSLDSVQTFGWMEGCVMDGLYELSRTGRSAGAAPAKSVKAKTVLQKHLDLFFANNSLVYANLNNRKAVGTINTVESILPFALLAQTNPGHPLLQTAVQFCEAHANADGVIADGTGPNRVLKTEECYTVSYPLAVLSKTLNRPDLAQLAIKTLQARVQLLVKGTGIFQRGTEQGIPVFENWSRGVVWYLLGLAKTLAHLPATAETEPLKATLQTAVNNVLAYQQPNGLWYCFMHQPETGYETSGTAGIAAALTYGVQKNLLPRTVLTAVERAKNGLATYLTPDGYLTGTAQGNKGGDDLQRGGFRVISPYTLGFLAHLTL